MSIEGLVSNAIVTITVTNGVPAAVQTGTANLPDGIYKLVVSRQTESLNILPPGDTAPPAGIVLVCISPKGAVESDSRFYRTIAQFGGLQVTVTNGVPAAAQMGPSNLRDGVYTIQEMTTNSGIQLLCTTTVYGETAGWLDL